jgi:hypothetical protein
MLQRLICNKQNNSNPTYGTLEDITNNRLSRINIFPYPFYFESNPLSDYPSVNLRRAGWSPEVNLKYESNVEDNYPKHCFQSACNTTFTYTKNECKEKEKNNFRGCNCLGCNRSINKGDDCLKCREDICITLFR